MRSGTFTFGAPALLVHGGAWDIPLDETEAHLDGLRQALAAGRRLLERGTPALDVVVDVVAVLEAHPAFDAGRGAVLDRDGRPQLDAGLMDGSSRRWGAVGNVRQLANPIRAARRLLDDDGQARLLVGEGAERYAAEVGLPHVETSSLVVDREQARFERLRAEAGLPPSASLAGEDAPRGTVGCVALDASGRLAAATSTGGAPYARSGRVGDSPIVGAGYYAGPMAAASATGMGEAILTVQLCARTVEAVERGTHPSDAAGQELARMEADVRWPGAPSPTGGLIVLDADGRGGWAYTTPRMARGGWATGGDPWVALEPA